MRPVESGSAAEISSWRSARDRAGADRAVRARRRERVGRVGGEAEDEDVDDEAGLVAVAKRSNAARMEVSVEAVMPCCFAREETGSRGPREMGKREKEEVEGGGARERRFGG